MALTGNGERVSAGTALRLGLVTEVVPRPELWSHAHELARLIPNARLRTLPDAGHWLVKTHAGQLLDLLLPWLAEQEVAV